jgi:hypothetical protein
MIKNKLKKGLLIYCLLFTLNFFLEKLIGSNNYNGFYSLTPALTWHDTISKIPTIAIISLVLVLAYFYVEKNMEK